MKDYNKKKCCACGVCSSVCPKKAITLKENDEGFKYPIVDKEKCIECGLCEKVCNYKNPQNINETQMAFAVVNKNNGMLLSSSSGGAFSAIATEILKKRGIVYGSRLYLNSLIVKHCRITKLEELNYILGSKYVQSDISEILPMVKDDVLKGEVVLFSGTPCQVDALNGYLGNKEYSNLITIEVICHGVPSVKMFADYISMVEKQENARVVDFSFRNKRRSPWKTLRGEIFIEKKGKKKGKLLSPILSSYYNMFLRGEIFRENCYECPYAKKERCSDITIGDYWGIEKNDSIHIDLEKGVSCLLINTNKAKDFVSRLHPDWYLIDADYEDIAMNNKQLSQPTKRNANRDKIINIYAQNGYEAVERAFNRSLGIKRYVYKIWERMPNTMKKMLKR